MKIKVDKTLCCGSGRCAAIAPEVYKLDDEGYNGMDGFEVPPELEDATRKGADDCPETAITLTES